MSLTEIIAGTLATVKAAAGVSVTYRRGADEVVLTAVKSEVAIELVQSGGAVVEAERTDWILAAADLVLAGSAAVPAEGDQIEQRFGALAHTYEVMPVASEGHCRPLDPCGQGYRIRTRLVSIA